MEKEPMKTYAIRLPDDLKRKLDTEAEKQGRNVSNLIRVILMDYLKKTGNKDN